MKLLIVRHAIAMDRDDYQSSPEESGKTAPASKQIRRKDDSLRPLTPEGLRKMRKNASGLARMIPKPTVLVTSPFTRALQTAELLNEVWPAVDLLECSALEPGSKPVDLLKWLRGHVDDEAICICLVGHEPHLSELVGWLLTGNQDTFIELKKGGACLIDFDDQPARASGRLIWHATPALLRMAR